MKNDFEYNACMSIKEKLKRKNKTLKSEDTVNIKIANLLYEHYLLLEPN